CIGARHYNAVMSVAEISTFVCKTEVLVNWLPPSDGWCIDGNKAGCGDLDRGSGGEWIGGFSKFVGEL
ncbi:hypothetical protein A2U01_0106762, partial [Trifolium medium]|nr:hypothetical protein [Trifolium medium]